MPQKVLAMCNIKCCWLLPGISACCMIGLTILRIICTGVCAGYSQRYTSQPARQETKSCRPASHDLRFASHDLCIKPSSILQITELPLVSFIPKCLYDLPQQAAILHELSCTIWKATTFASEFQGLKCLAANPGSHYYTKTRACCK